ncbi:hypothetical protein B0H14DRAFT_3483358 [Mycena olivaceomarginata]|nr:hypothetical protein B0H14DRAFT_3483358 [Mycena olivaceomarginata]
MHYIELSRRAPRRDLLCVPLFEERLPGSGASSAPLSCMASLPRGVQHRGRERRERQWEDNTGAGAWKGSGGDLHASGAGSGSEIGLHRVEERVAGEEGPRPAVPRGERVSYRARVGMVGGEGEGDGERTPGSDGHAHSIHLDAYPTTRSRRRFKWPRTRARSSDRLRISRAPPPRPPCRPVFPCHPPDSTHEHAPSLPPSRHRTLPCQMRIGSIPRSPRAACLRLLHGCVLRRGPQVASSHWALGSGRGARARGRAVRVRVVVVGVGIAPVQSHTLPLHMGWAAHAHPAPPTSAGDHTVKGEGRGIRYTRTRTPHQAQSQVQVTPRAIACLILSVAPRLLTSPSPLLVSPVSPV